jgi:DAPG hydrolase-like protein
MAHDAYLGYRDGDADTPFGKFFQPEMAALPRHVVEALEHGPQAEPTLLAFSDAASLLDEGYHQTENGYGVLRGGGMQVSVRTDMPGVTPAMWAWWFGWHGSDSRRYKLWHPRAHVSAQWSDGGGDGSYVGRTSNIEEYLGSTYVKVAVQFVTPATLGLGSVGNHEVAVCARIGASEFPVDIGWFVHHVRATPHGSEMRSRFWMGGPHLALRSRPHAVGQVLRPLAARRVGAASARDLIVHCAQEMNHLAGYLPALYEQFGGQ